MQIWQGGGDGSDVAKIENIAVQCEKTFIKVEVKFDRPFAGMIYSKGHYSDQGRKRRGQIGRFSRFTNICMKRLERAILDKVPFTFDVCFGLG